MEFEFDVSIFDKVTNLLPGVDITSAETLLLINSSPLLVSLLNSFKGKNRELLFGTNSKTTHYDGTNIVFKGKYEGKKPDNIGKDFIRLLGHELGHFFDDISDADDEKNIGLADDESVFSYIINREMDESQATVISYIIRR